MTLPPMVVVDGAGLLMSSETLRSVVVSVSVRSEMRSTGARSMVSGVVVRSAQSSRTNGDASGSSRSQPEPWWRLRPGWPLTALFVGFPLWWVLGVSNVVGLVAAVLMVSELVRRRRIHAPSGFGWWLLFLAWVAVGVFVLQVNAPGAVPGASAARYATWAFRLGWYITATVSLLYVGNMRAELSTQRITRTLGVMFLVVAGGGWLGIVAPHLEFPSLLELVLPNSLARIPFVDFLIHPQVAQLYDGAASQTPRPSAPFAYSNIWGLNFACYLPFFIAGWWSKDAGWRRPLAPVLLLLALVPAVLSLNRGLWLALVVAAVFIAARSALSGNVKLFAGVLAAVCVAAVLLLATPLNDMVQHRLDNPTSNEGRTNLGMQTVESVMSGSPVVGLGTTRDVQGSFYSIAGGSHPTCPLCSPPALGTQGHLWLVVFSQGAVGLLLYVGFYARQFLTHLRLKSPYVTAALTVLLMHAVTMPVYDSIGTSMFAIMIAVGLLWREEDSERAGAAARVNRLREESRPTLGGYLGLFRRHAPLVATCVLLGLAGGALWRMTQGTPAVATVSVVIPEEPTYLAAERRPQTLDTEAQFAVDSAVLDGMRPAVGHTIAQRDLYVSADPNTRILNLHFTGRDSAEAIAGATQAAHVLLDLRTKDLASRSASAMKVLEMRGASLDKAINTLDVSASLLNSRKVRDRHTQEIRTLQENRYRLLVQAGVVSSRIGRAESLPLDPGHVIRPAVARTTNDVWNVALSSGAMLGLALGLLLGRLRDAVSSRLTRRRVVGETGLPVLAELTARDLRTGPSGDGSTGSDPESGAGWDEAALSVMLHQTSACLAVGGDEQSARVASCLQRFAGSFAPTPVEAMALSGVGRRRSPGGRSAPGGRVVLVASRRTRVRRVIQLRDSLVLAGHEVVGMVLIDR